MPVYYRWQQGEFHSVLGELGIGIDAVVNSQETKLLIQRLYKADLQTRRFIKAKEDEEDRVANIKYFAYLERHLGSSLRHFFEFGDRYKILGWFRRYASDIIYWVLLSYGFMWVMFTR